MTAMEEDFINGYDISKNIKEASDYDIKRAVDRMSEEISIQIGQQIREIFLFMKESDYRPGTFLRTKSGDIFLHDGHVTADGLVVVCMYRKDRGIVEWSSGIGNFCYSGEVEPASSVEIRDLLRKITYEGQKRYY